MEDAAVRAGNENDDELAEPFPDRSAGISWLVLAVSLLPPGLSLARTTWNFDAFMGFLTSLLALRTLIAHYTARAKAFQFGRRGHSQKTCRRKKGKTMDLLFVGITTVFFLASWGFVKLCEHI